MVKKLVILALSCAFCLGASVPEIASGLLGNNKSKANSLFTNEADYLNEKGEPDIAKISNALKSNSLLNLAFKQNARANVKFISHQNSSVLLIKIVKDALNRLGYNEILTNEFINSESSVWSVTLNTKFMLDPGAFYTALRDTNTQIIAINKISDLSYEYILDLQNSSINQTPVEFSSEVQLSKPLEPYIIDISGAKLAKLGANEADHWWAVVRILDKNLNLLDEKRSEKEVKNLDVLLPSGAKYLMIDDANSLENIKHGLKIYLE